METLVKTKWLVDPTHSELIFKVKHMMISTVTGHFERYDGAVEAAGDDFSNAEIEFSIDVNSINTKNSDRDIHLKSADFFNADEYGEIKFKSTSFNGSKLTGDLTVKDVTKEVTFDVDFNGIAVDPYGQTKAGFEAEAEINRKEFGLTWSAVTDAGSIVVSDKVKLSVNVQFVKQ